MWSNDMSSNRLNNWNFRVHTKFKEVNMEYLCNTNVVIDKNIILNIENICYDKFKEKIDFVLIIFVTKIIVLKTNNMSYCIVQYMKIYVNIYLTMLVCIIIMLSICLILINLYFI